MSRTMPPSRPPTDPQHGRGARGGEQLPLLVTDEWEASPYNVRHARLHGMLDAAVIGHEGGAVAFAAKMERPVPDVSRRLRRAEDSKGETQRAPLDYLSFLDREARHAFLDAISAAWGYLPPRPVVEMSDADKARILAEELPERRLRQIERERGLPSGSLS
jgi:hypothetical protein